MVSNSSKKVSTPTRKTSKAKGVKASSLKKYVLDTNILLHDPTSLFRFAEHDIVIPMVVLEELDRHKKGIDDVARNARQVSRTLNQILQAGSIIEGFSLLESSNGSATGRLYFLSSDDVAIDGLEENKADNQILACTMRLLKDGEIATLVTKDINLRVKAMASGVPAQDYRNDKVFEDEDVLPTGFRYIDSSFWLDYASSERPTMDKKWETTEVSISLPLNSFLAESVSPTRTRIWRVIEADHQHSVLRVVRNQLKDNHKPLLEPRNNEQIMAMELLLNPDIDIVSLLGKAGSGKTLMAIAAGLEQVRMGRYKEVLLTRVTVPMGEEIGFLPGTEQDKMGPWLGGTLRDSLMALGILETDDLIKKIEIGSMSFMRGRSFHDKYIIIDEAQNMTIGQMHALLTRPADTSKVVVTGNIAQIDSPYLDAGSSGLSWGVKTLENWAHSGHLILPRGERGRLASYIEDHAHRE